jgi:hypothetical protein
MIDPNKRKISLGVIGLGKRGTSLLQMLLDMEDVEVPALCEVYEDRLLHGVELVKASGRPAPATYRSYEELLERSDVEAVLIATSWTTHVEIAIAAMKAGKKVGMEVGGATSLEELWALVRTYEETRVSFMMLENCCYGRHELAVLNMVKKGLFGEIVHCQGGYQHDLRDEVGLGDVERHYRFEQYLHRNGENYPTHELGPIAKVLDINRGNRFLTLTSMASKARGLHEWFVNTLGPDHPKTKLQFAQGDIVTTMIKCARGETILLVLDTTLPRPYSRGGRIQGTKGIWMEDNASIHLEGRSPAHQWEPFGPYMEEFEHPLWRKYLEYGVRGGHDGMDFLTLRAWLESVRDGSHPPIDVYDAAAWMAVTVLSEQSIALGSAPVPFPDFTNGKWTRTEPKHTGMYSLDLIVE